MIDEVQKLLKLLDRVHLEIEQSSVRFVLTGSSARKLKHGAANLLAGRAFTHHLFPLTSQELGGALPLETALAYGSLPKLLALDSEEFMRDYLSSYVSTYLAEEIVAEQVVRRIHPFKDFLKIAAQANDTILNFLHMAFDLGIDDKTVKSYFEILEDTLLGFFLRPYHRSVRKQQREAPKFYLFDTGVKRAMERSLRVPLESGTYAYGKAFEHRVILEAHWLNQYRKLDYDFSYLRTKDNAEVDLIIERPGERTILVEIKSSARISERDCRTLLRFKKAWREPVDAQIWSLDPEPKELKGCQALPWRQGLQAAGLEP